LEATRSAHRREVSLLEARIAELKDSHRREVTNLQDELTARRGEASEMRQAAERQQQREAALRWQTATMKGERDSAITELRIWSGSSWYQRLMSRPRLPAASGALTTNQPALFDVTSHDE
jgi:TolA-binding protein